MFIFISYKISIAFDLEYGCKLKYKKYKSRRLESAKYQMGMQILSIKPILKFGLPLMRPEGLQSYKCHF